MKEANDSSVYAGFELSQKHGDWDSSAAVTPQHQFSRLPTTPDAGQVIRPYKSPYAQKTGLEKKQNAPNTPSASTEKSTAPGQLRKDHNPSKAFTGYAVEGLAGSGIKSLFPTTDSQYLPPIGGVSIEARITAVPMQLDLQRATELSRTTSSLSQLQGDTSSSAIQSAANEPQYGSPLLNQRDAGNPESRIASGIEESQHDVNSPNSHPQNGNMLPQERVDIRSWRSAASLPAFMLDKTSMQRKMTNNAAKIKKLQKAIMEGSQAADNDKSSTTSHLHGLASPEKTPAKRKRKSTPSPKGNGQPTSSMGGFQTPAPLDSMAATFDRNRPMSPQSIERHSDIQNSDSKRRRANNHPSQVLQPRMPSSYAVSGNKMGNSSQQQPMNVMSVAHTQAPPAGSLAWPLSSSFVDSQATQFSAASQRLDFASNGYGSSLHSMSLSHGSNGNFVGADLNNATHGMDRSLQFDYGRNFAQINPQQQAYINHRLQNAGQHLQAPYAQFVPEGNAMMHAGPPQMLHNKADLLSDNVMSATNAPFINAGHSQMQQLLSSREGGYTQQSVVATPQNHLGSSNMYPTANMGVNPMQGTYFGGVRNTPTPQPKRKPTYTGFRGGMRNNPSAPHAAKTPMHNGLLGGMDNTQLPFQSSFPSNYGSTVNGQQTMPTLIQGAPIYPNSRTPMQGYMALTHKEIWASPTM